MVSEGRNVAKSKGTGLGKMIIKLLKTKFKF